jgi:hypothetical protein
MSNKQIHELRKLDKLDFNPTTDNFLVQKKGGGTYKSSITHLIDSPSANLPGTKSWAWNWLDEPEDLIGYRGTFVRKAGNLATEATGGARAPANSHKEKISASWLQKEVDGKKEASSIPSSARSVLMSAFTRDCNFKCFRARSTPVSNIKILSEFTGSKNDHMRLAWHKHGPSVTGDGMPLESLFIVDHVGIPQDRTLGHGNKIAIDDGSRVTFEIDTQAYFLTARSDRRRSGRDGLSSSVSDSYYHSELFYVKMLAWA